MKKNYGKTLTKKNRTSTRKSNTKSVSKKKPLSKQGLVKAKNKTGQFTYYCNPKTKMVLKDTDKDGKLG